MQFESALQYVAFPRILLINDEVDENPDARHQGRKVGLAFVHLSHDRGKLTVTGHDLLFRLAGGN